MLLSSLSFIRKQLFYVKRSNSKNTRRISSYEMSLALRLCQRLPRVSKCVQYAAAKSVQPTPCRFIHLSSTFCKKKSPSSKKNKPENAIDKLLDELSDDEEEEVGEEDSGMTRRVNINYDSPVNKFLTSKGKGSKASKSAIGVTYADVCAVLDIDEVWKSMETIVHDLQHHFMHHVTLRYEWV